MDIEEEKNKCEIASNRSRITLEEFSKNRLPLAIFNKYSSKCFSIDVCLCIYMKRLLFECDSRMKRAINALNGMQNGKRMGNPTK